MHNIATIPVMIAVLEAFRKGEQIQVRTNDGWEDVAQPDWNWSNHTFRVRPKEVNLATFLLDVKDVLNTHGLLGFGENLEFRGVTWEQAVAYADHITRKDN